MRRFSLRALLGALLALALLAGPAAARPAAADLAPPPAADGARIAAAFAKLSRATTWQLVRKVPLKFDAHHPEGVARVGDHFVLSAVEVTEPTQRYQPPGTIIDGTDRTPGKGIGHLIAFDAQGNQLDDVRLGDGANIYHPGGLDYDGRGAVGRGGRVPAEQALDHLSRRPAQPAGPRGAAHARSHRRDRARHPPRPACSGSTGARARRTSGSSRRAARG